MIINDRQLHRTHKWIEKFKDAVHTLELSSRVPSPDSVLINTQINALKSQIDDFQKEINDYHENIAILTHDPPAPPYEASLDSILVTTYIKASGSLPTGDDLDDQVS